MSEPSHGSRGHGGGRRRAGAHSARPPALYADTAPPATGEGEWPPGGGDGRPGGAERVPGTGDRPPGTGDRPPGGRAAARKAARKGAKGNRRGRRILKIVALAMGFVVLLAGGAAGYAYWKLNHNIKHDDLSANGKDGAGHEKPDAFGRTPINILVIGSDERNSAEDCKLGGACKDGKSGGERADVEILVHISADRSNATMMSIPRDLRTSWSGCHDEGHAQMGAQHNAMINSALNGGPGCSVVAVHELTGIPIDHFMKVGFTGVVDMSNAVGGVQVCVSANIYDPYSGLKLKGGSKHTLQGKSALQFLRTRHGFGDGTDSRGRTDGQHVFMTALLNKLKGEGTLGSTSKMWKLANAATKALTTDNGLNLKKLIGLGNDMNKVPTKRVTFATLQTQDLASGTQLVQPGASALFQTIANDQSLTTADGKAVPSATASATPTVPPSQIPVKVENGAAKDGALVPNRAGDVKTELVNRGFTQATAVTGTQTASTALTYPTGQEAQAKSVAKALGIPAKDVKEDASATGVVLVVGSDWTTGVTFPGGKTDATDADRKKALDGANKQLGDDIGKCATVSKFSTVIGLDRNYNFTTNAKLTRHGMSPSAAYDKATKQGIKDSAP